MPIKSRYHLSTKKWSFGETCVAPHLWFQGVKCTACKSKQILKTTKVKARNWMVNLKFTTDFCYTIRVYINNGSHTGYPQPEASFKILNL